MFVRFVWKPAETETRDFLLPLLENGLKLIVCGLVLIKRLIAAAFISSALLQTGS